MTIAELLSGLDVKRVSGSLERQIKGIAYDSRLVQKGFLFVAIKGFTVDGHDYIKEALSRGVEGVVIEKAIDLQQAALIEVENSREALAKLSAAFYGEPSKNLSLIGITGTNGKTTTSYIIKSILEAPGEKVGLLGTNKYVIGKKILPAPHTTPESLDLQRFLREMVNNNIEYGVLEVSSHALALNRIDGCSLKVAAFTNFTQDHLDFHYTMDKYFAAKSKIFNYLVKDGFAVLNWDDPMVRSLIGRLDCNFITCGLEEGAMLRAGEVEPRTQTGLSFEILAPDGRFTVNSELAGRNNIYNILMAVGVAYALGVDKKTIIQGVRAVASIEGRFERVDEGQEFQCIIDYAHTEDALKNLLKETRLITNERVITVFGCGGDRDKTKRPRMGAAAADLSDLVIITSDNPRTEKPVEIIKDIVKGIDKNNYMTEPDRAKAIEKAVSIARSGDVLIIAGKGHENYQEIKGERLPFSDKEVFKEIIKNPKIKYQKSKLRKKFK